MSNHRVYYAGYQVYYKPFEDLDILREYWNMNAR